MAGTITVFYRPAKGVFGGTGYVYDFGHVMAEVRDSTGKRTSLDVWREEHGNKMYVNPNVDDKRRAEFADKLTFEVSDQKIADVVKYMNDKRANPGIYDLDTNSCVTVTAEALRIAGLLNFRKAYATPADLWKALLNRVDDYRLRPVYVDATSIRGVLGAVGQISYVGEMGEVGQVAETGIHGVVGVRGLVGVAGQVGEMGEVGQVAETGIHGAVGVRGLVGVAGQVG
ncbi:hypothetical protein AB0J07_05360, partial [Microbispora rosea]